MADAQGQDEVWHLFDRQRATEPDTETEPTETPEPAAEGSKRRFEPPVPAHS